MKAQYSLILFIFTIALSTSLLAAECDLNSPVKTFHPQYATHFSIDYFKTFKILHVDNDQYLLSDRSDLGCEISLLKISTPVKRIVMMSTTYLPTLELLHQEKSLIGFQGKHYIVSPVFKLDQIKEVSFKFNPEYLLGLKADLIMGYDSNLSTPKQRQILHSLKIPVVINKDFEEKTPLGRAEWLIFISSFYDQDDLGVKTFKNLQENYLALKAKNLKLAKKAQVIVGEIQNGYWVTCGSDSDLGQMIKDAGGELGPKHPSAQTQKISLEELSQVKTVFDVWLTHNLWASKKELDEAMKKDKRYTLIRAKNIYNNNLVMNINHSNDYWETGLQRPDLLLLDLTAIFHPEDYKGYKSHWYRKL
jgi:iron complex transport system substrate-binding protein